MRPYLRFYFCIFILYIPVFLSAQINMPFLENFSRDVYHGGTQNWAVAQGHDGIMYFANNDGLLTFDGKKWKSYKLPSGIRLRALYVNDDGRIYSGGFEEFGYWEKDDRGNLIYCSLSKQFNDFELRNDEVWSIAKLKGTIYFQTFSSYFSYDGKNVKGEKLGFTPLSFKEASDCIYVNVAREGLYAFNGSNFKLILPVQQVGNSDITAILPLENEDLILCTGSAGMFYYNHSTCIPWAAAYSSDLSRAVINRATMTSDSIYIIGTIHDGVYAFDKHQQLAWKIGKDQGLQNSTVLGLCVDSFNNVWVGLDNGISLILQSLPFRFSSKNLDKVGSVYSVRYVEPYLYLGTNQGLYKYDLGKDDYAYFFPEISGQVWDIANLGNQLIIGYNDGAFRIKGNEITRLASINGGACVRQFRHNGAEYLIQGTYTHLVVYKKNGVGDWELAHVIQEFVNPVRQMEIDHCNNIWASHVEKGLFKVKLDNNLEKAQEIKLYKSLSEDRPQEKIYVSKIGGRIIFGNGIQLYTYDDLTDSIISFDKLNEQLGEFKSLHKIIPVNDNRYWLVNNNMFALVTFVDNKLTFLRKIPFSYLNNKLVNEFENVTEIAKDTYIFCLENSVCLYRYEHGADENRAKGKTFFNSVQVSSPGKNTVYLPVNSVNRTKLEYDKDNTLTFDVAFPDYCHKDYYIKYRMDGLGENWTKTANNLPIKYSRLPYGKYTFEADIYSASDELLDKISYPVTINPPFYLSYWAFAFYVLLFMGLIIGVKWYISHTIKRNRQKIEQEQERLRREELERQEKNIIQLKSEKLEAELTHKSKELASSTMLIINKNKVLQVLKDELTAQKEALGTQYPNKYYNKLVHIIDENIGSDNDWEVFQTNFDRIHEGFFRKLKATYPDLTANDLKLCAFLRLNLSTKDIAHLMNISVRGVEMGRYRVRKKLNISSEENLVEFMIEFK